ncbi:thiolase family protein [Blastococcus saxobsidens]|uniref:Putative thiolase n=1 Tax=Blastococcus saxobsidens (strain DD2) TaxID=1146883 RepID=H6RSY1_BLASD|nr:thiolase family protein [Blastococcus saxobsidens]CCG04284.1 putative thiolase [Blastococcus saxobsidens DD2]
MAWIAGVGLTAFGRQAASALDWQTQAAREALSDGAVAQTDVDGLIVGYATTLNHLMPANLLAEHLGVQPDISFGMSVGGATGIAMLAQAARLVDSGAAGRVLVVAGEDRASGQTVDTSMTTLAQVGHRDYEVPVGANVPGYYALLASAYLHRHGLHPDSLAHLAVQMRTHAGRHPGAHFREGIEVADVLASRRIADPLRLLDCCPVSDGGAAVLVTDQPTTPRNVRVAGLGQAHLHQHISEADFDHFGARRSAGQALVEASVDIDDIDIAGVYDSFTITVALLLEEIGLAEAGRAGAMAAAGEFDLAGAIPLNTHGGLLSYGHSGVAGGMAHLVEVVTQLRAEAEARQIPRSARWGLVHADGGVMSAHVTAVLEGPATAALSPAEQHGRERPT